MSGARIRVGLRVRVRVRVRVRIRVRVRVRWLGVVRQMRCDVTRRRSNRHVGSK